MKVIDAVKRSFLQYPSLYVGDNYDDVKFNIMHHYFIVLGNGIEWAHTKDPKKSGYLIEPSSIKRKGEWKRKIDLPYGKFKIEDDLAPFFIEKIYEFGEIDHNETKRWLDSFSFLKDELEEKVGKIYLAAKRNWNEEYREYKKKVFLESELSNLPKGTLMPGDKYNESYTYFVREVKRKKEKRSAYPNFRKEYSCFWEEGSEYIQDDWKQEGLEHMLYFKDYFNDEAKLKTYWNYPDAKKLKEHIVKYCISKGESIKKIAKDYEFPKFDGENYEELAWNRWDKELKRTKLFVDQTIEKLKK